MVDWTRARRILLFAGVVSALVACSTACSATDEDIYVAERPK
jgi:hypothetical protein